MKQAFAGIILLFITFVFNVYFVVPKYVQFKKAKNEVAKEEALLKQTQDYLANIKEISANLENYQDALDRINAALPGEFSLPSLLSFFQTEAVGQGLLLKNISEVIASPTEAGKKQAPAKLKEGHLQLTIKGAVSSFENFLKTIEKSSRLIEVGLFSLKQSEAQLPEFDLSVKVYSY